MTSRYTGRFAPSPTGPMHFGTLIAAVVSYLQAKSNAGRWLLRIEDVDLLRKVDGADMQIIQSLRNFGFEWDGDIVYQAQRTDAYQQALDILEHKDLVFPCTCSRKQLAAETGQWSPVYPGTCRQSRDWEQPEYSIRCKVDKQRVDFEDAIFGKQSEQLDQQVGDFVIKRRDGLFAYQLAVVVDDAWQGVTEVVRGTDLLDSTGRQVYLQSCLDYESPRYLHFPVALDKQGNKLSKSSGSQAIDETRPVESLNRVLAFLGQQQVAANSLDDFWQQAIALWDTSKIPRTQSMDLD